MKRKICLLIQGLMPIVIVEAIGEIVPMKRNFFLLIQGLTPIVIVEAIGEIVTEI
jgi:hypothetical protein